MLYVAYNLGNTSNVLQVVCFIIHQSKSVEVLSLALRQLRKFIRAIHENKKIVQIRNQK